MTEETNTKPTKLTLFRSIGLSFFLLVLTCWWMWGNKRPLGHDDWTLQISEFPLPWRTMALVFLSLFLFGGLIGFFAYDRFKRAKTRKEQTQSTRWCIFAIMMFAVVWPWTLNSPLGSLFQVEVTWSDVSNQYFSTAYQIEDSRRFTRDFATQWQEAHSRLQAHVATHPPGAVLFYYFARRSLEALPFLQDIFSSLAERLSNDTVSSLAVQANDLRAASARSAGLHDAPFSLPVSAVPAALWCDFLLSLALALTIPAVYLLASSGSNEGGIAEARGLLAALLFALAPGVANFTFTLDMLIACGAAWSIAFAVRYWQNEKAGWLIAAGVLLALTSFLSFGALATGVIIAFVLIAQGIARGFTAAMKPLLIYLFGFLLTWVVLTLIFPMQPLAIFSTAMIEHSKATLHVRDPKWWAWLNILFFLFFMGWPAAVGLITRVASRELWNVKNSSMLPFSLRVSGWAVLLTMLALTLSGHVLGEVERLWLFLLPPCMVLATTSFVSAPLRRVQAWQWLALLGMQAAQTILMIVMLRPSVSPI